MTTSQSNCIRKDMSDMSFVGLHNTMEGIIGFADSKATKIFNDNHYEEDIQRGKIRKIFINSKFICVTHGNNELFSFNNKISIEDYFIEYLKDETYTDFFRMLFNRLLKDSPEYNNGVYEFIIGSKDSMGYYIVKLTIDVNNEIMKYSEPDYKKRVYYAGEDKYVRIYDLLKMYIDFPIIRYSQVIEKQVNLMIELFDTEIEYNSVGKPVNVEVFQ